MKTTLNKIRAHDPCVESWVELLDSLGKTKADDTEVSILYILDLLGFDDAMWALQKIVEGYDREIRLLCCDYAEHVLPVWDEQHPDDTSVKDCIETSRRYARGEAGRKELWAAAKAVERVLRGAEGLLAMWAGLAAVRAAKRSIWSTARAAAAAAAAARKAGSDAEAAALVAERKWQEGKLRELLRSIDED